MGGGPVMGGAPIMGGGPCWILVPLNSFLAVYMSMRAIIAVKLVKQKGPPASTPKKPPIMATVNLVRWVAKYPPIIAIALNAIPIAMKT